MPWKKNLFLTTLAIWVNLSVGIGQTLPFLPGSVGQNTITSPEVKVVIAGIEECDTCGGGYSFDFVVTDQQTGAVNKFSLQNTTAQIDSLTLPGSNVLEVLGHANGVAQIVTLMDLKSGSITDWFYGTFVSLSSNGRRIALVNFIPHFTPADQVGTQYRVYNLSPPTGASSDEFSPGTQVYPQSNSTGQHSLASTGLFWLDDVHVAFADAYNGQVDIIVAKAVGGKTAQVTPLPLDQVLDLQNCSDVSTARAAIQISNIQLLSQSSVSVQFVPTQCLKTSALTLQIGQIDD